MNAWSNRSTHCHRRGGGVGFTLVELLVVIGIIAVLISILMPVLGRARQSAQTVKCLSNLRQIGLAIMQYSVDNKSFLVPGEITKAGAVVDTWNTILVVGKYLPAPSQESVGSSSFENSSDGDSTFRCPSGINNRLGVPITPSSPYDGRGAGFTRWQSLDLQPNLRVDTWYGINGWTASDATNGPNAFKRYPFTRVPGTSAYVQKLHRLTEFRENTTLPLVFDGYYWLQQTINHVNARHAGNKAANVVFADGHAETIHIDRMPVDVKNTYLQDFHFLLTRP